MTDLFPILIHHRHVGCSNQMVEIEFRLLYFEFDRRISYLSIKITDAALFDSPVSISHLLVVMARY